MDRGFVPSIEELNRFLVGGPAPIESLRGVAERSALLRLEGDLVSVSGMEELVEKSLRRRRSNSHLRDRFLRIAVMYASELAAHCPFIKTIAICGSLATGGFSEEDDIDLNIITEDGTRYTTYLLANLLGLKYSVMLRNKPTDRLHRTPFLPKVICINVIVEESWTRPFRRQDEQMAFELLVSMPVFGSRYFRQLLQHNDWILRYFPQALDGVATMDVAARPTALNRLLRFVSRHQGLLRLLEWASRQVAWILYRYVHWTRRGDPEAVERIEFIRRVKEPYEVFQD